MKKFQVVIIALVCIFSFLSIANALESALDNAEISAEYTIVEKTVIVKISFKNVSNLKLKIPYDSKAIEANREYEIKSFENYKLIKVASAEDLVIKYITKSPIEISKDKYFFIIENPFKEKADIRIYLPESAVLGEKKLIFPQPSRIWTDGRRIIIDWKNLEEENILVEYEFIEKGNYLFYVVLSILITFVIVLYNHEKKKLNSKIQQIKKKAKEKKKPSAESSQITKNLIEDEKRIVEFLLKKKDNECWTKEIIKELGISKVKLSRKLRSLEQKEIIKKIPYGNENRIKLIKTS